MKTDSASGLSRKLLFYGLGAGAATMAATTAHASVIFTDLSADPAATGDTIYYNLTDTTGSLSSTGAEFELNGANGTTPESEGQSVPKAKNSSFFSAGSGTLNGGPDGFYALELSKGTTIGSSTGFSTLSGTLYADGGTNFWKVGDTGYLGLEIMVGTKTDYGWAKVTLNSLPLPITDTVHGPGFNAAPNGYFTLLGYAYDNSGNPIAAGAIPEPASTTALLVAGAAGVAALRRRRAGAAE